MLTVILALLIFGLLVTVHEFGHFITAKKCGVTVHEFAIGMGPALYKRQGKETLFSVRLIPVGGYCKMEGEDDDSDAPGSFNRCKKRQKVLILAAGAVMNLILGYLITVVIMFQSQTIIVPVIDSLVDGYPASSVLQVGDEIVRVNNTRVYTNAELSTALTRSNGECTLTVNRGGERINVNITPKADESGRLLFGFKGTEKQLGFFSRFFYAYRNTVNYSKIIINSLGDLITGRVGMENLSGPAGIVGAIGDAAESSKQVSSAIPLLSFVAFITINLGVFNLLPVPALDGGRILFVLISAIIGREIPPEKEGLVHFVGLLLLFGLVIFATRNDILRMFAG